MAVRFEYSGSENADESTSEDDGNCNKAGGYRGGKDRAVSGVGVTNKENSCGYCDCCSCSDCSGASVRAPARTRVVVTRTAAMIFGLYFGSAFGSCL